MERLKGLYDNLQQALKTLQEAIEDVNALGSVPEKTYKTYRDSIIQRFE